MYTASMIALAMYHSSKASNFKRLDPTSACFLKSCRDSGIKR